MAADRHGWWKDAATAGVQFPKRLNLLAAAVSDGAPGLGTRVACPTDDAGLASTDEGLGIMLRITRQSGTDNETLLLEGKLLSQWLQELQHALEQAAASRVAIRLDLSGLSFIDVPAADFLRQCRKDGVSLAGASPFVNALLDPPPKRR
jgi:ABC-type transporter Mla MlaB component